jgi:chromosome partitioning protein
MLAIACLSQKGGVGKSTLARLIARTYATGGWQVKIADFNIKQKTSVDWAAVRMGQGVEPEIPAEAYTEVSRAMKNAMELDLMVFDGKPDSDTQTLSLAKEADLVVIPTGLSADDLAPQVRFGQELKARGVANAKMLFVLNKVTDSPAGINEARTFITDAGFKVAKTTLPVKTAYVNAQNAGRTLAETEYDTLNARSITLAQEIIDRTNELTGS